MQIITKAKPLLRKKKICTKEGRNQRDLKRLEWINSTAYICTNVAGTGLFRKEYILLPSRLLTYKETVSQKSVKGGDAENRNDISGLIQ